MNFSKKILTKYNFTYIMITNNSKGEINMKKLICLLVICANLVGVAVNVSAYSVMIQKKQDF